MNNPYFISAISGIIVYIVQLLLKNSKGETIHKMDMVKISLVVSIGVFAILGFYEREKLPILTEPFISSSEV